MRIHTTAVDTVMDMVVATVDTISKVMGTMVLEEAITVMVEDTVLDAVEVQDFVFVNFQLLFQYNFRADLVAEIMAGEVGEVLVEWVVERQVLEVAGTL